MRSSHLALLVATLALPPHLVAQGVAYEGGVSVATGTYIFSTRTTSVTIATGLAYAAGRLTLRAGLPVFVQNTSLLAGSGAGMMPRSGGNVGGGGMMRGGSGSSMAHYRTAAGDPTVQVGWRLVNQTRTGVTLSVAAKIPVTDTTAYGTGEWDVDDGFVTRTYCPPRRTIDRARSDNAAPRSAKATRVYVTEGGLGQVQTSV